MGPGGTVAAPQARTARSAGAAQRGRLLDRELRFLLGMATESSLWPDSPRPRNSDSSISAAVITEAFLRQVTAAVTLQTKRTAAVQAGRAASAASAPPHARRTQMQPELHAGRPCWLTGTWPGYKSRFSEGPDLAGRSVLHAEAQEVVSNQHGHIGKVTTQAAWSDRDV